MLQRQHNLEHARKPRRGFQVPNLGLEGPHGDLLFFAVFEHLTNARQFDFVTLGSPGAMAFHDRDRFGVDAGVFIHPRDAGFLTVDSWNVDPGCCAVTGGGTASDDRMDGVVIFNGMLKPFQDKHHTALANQHPFAVVVVGLQRLVFRKDRRLGKGHVHSNGVVRTGRPGNHCPAVAVQQFINRHLQRHHGTGTRRIDDTIHTI